MTPTHAQLAERCAELIARAGEYPHATYQAELVGCITELLEALRQAEAAKLSTRLIDNVDKSFEYDAGERGWRPIVTVEFALTQCDSDSESWTARDAFAKAIDAALNPEAKT